MDLSEHVAEKKVFYELDRQQEVLIRYSTGEQPKIISKRNFIWRDFGPEDEMYARAIFLGEGCWENLETVSEAQANSVLSKWDAESRARQKTNESAKTGFVLKGNICYSVDKDTLKTVQAGYLVCLDGKSAGVYTILPEAFLTLPLIDYGDNLIIPGMVDLHIHAPQFAAENLHTHTVPQKLLTLLDIYDQYEIFANDLKKSATTRAVIYSEPHKVASEILMGVLEDAGLAAYVSADKDAKEYPSEPTNSIFAGNICPGSSESEMETLRWMHTETSLPVLAHFGENSEEMDSRKNHCNENLDHCDIEPHKKALVVHCDWSTENELLFMQKHNVFVAHCCKGGYFGFAALRMYLDRNIPTGLGSENMVEPSNSIFHGISYLLYASKSYQEYINKNVSPVLFSEAFYMATKGGGAFFGSVGSFEPGYEFDAVVLDDSMYPYSPPTLAKRVERAVRVSLDEEVIIAKYIRGNQII